jgi:CHAD domain-containing protein
MAKRWEELDGSADARSSAGYLVAVRLGRLSHHVHRIKGNEADPDAVHQIRVYCRRTQSAVDVLAEVLSGKQVAKILRTLPKLRRAAGKVRDWDVLADELRNIRDQALSSERAGIDFLLEQYRRQRAEGVGRLARRIHKIERKKRFWDWARKHFSSPPSSSAVAESIPPAETEEGSLGGLAKEKIASELAIFERAVASYSDQDTEQLHLLRLAVKRLRYVLEVFAGCFDQRFREHIYQPVARWQEWLGSMNDSHEFALRLDDWAREVRDDELARSLIALRDRYTRRLEEAARQFRENWSQAELDEVLGEIRSALGLPASPIPTPLGADPSCPVSPIVTNPDSD